MVKQFVRTLKGNAFDWYTDLEPESIDSWEQLEREFLNRFYSTRRIVSMIELTATKQRKGEPVIDYINRWRALSLDCKDRLTELSAVEMCTQGMHWGLLYILQGIKPRTFEELATRAHDMKLSIANRGSNDLLVPDVKKEKKEVKSTQKTSKGATKEAMVIDTTPLKFVSKEKKTEKRQDTGEKRRPTLKERQEKVYPFPDSDLPDMLEQLVDHKLIKLPECKRPAEMGRINDPNYCKYHRVISHPIEKCFVLKELILKLAQEKKIELDLGEVAQANHATVMLHSYTQPSTTGCLIRFGSFDPVFVQFSQESQDAVDSPQVNLQQKDDPQNDADEGWTLVTRRKKRGQTYAKKEARLFRDYKRKSKSQRKKGRKIMRMPQPVREESMEPSRVRQPITLLEFFPKDFAEVTVACHTISAAEEESTTKELAEETPKLEGSPSFSLNELLTLPQESKEALIVMLRGENTSSVSTPQYNNHADCCISFTDEDLLLGTKLHNRPLFVSGYIREQRLGRILIDDGSAVNIMPKSTMSQLGITIQELSNSRLVIQGFNQGGQRAIGMIRLEVSIGDLTANTLFHIIDSRTTYKLLLGRPWIHENGVVTSTLHQCFKFYQQGIRKVNADSKPFTEAESHFADAKFYMKSEDVSEIISNEVPLVKHVKGIEQPVGATKSNSETNALNNQ